MPSVLRLLLLAALLAAYAFGPVARAQSWTSGPPMNHARSDAAVAVLEGPDGPELYVIGGRTTTGTALGVVERYVVAEGEWERVASLREERHSAAAAVLNGQIVLMGGKEDDGRATDDVEVYVRGENDWESFQSMDRERNGPAAAVVNGRIYALGGAGEDGAFLETCEYYDPNDDAWYAYAPWMLDPGRASFGAAAVGGSAYLAGGFTQLGPVALFERYDFGNGAATLAPLSSPRGRLALVSTGEAFDDDLFAIGGEEADGAVGTVERYDIDRGMWETVAPLQTPRSGAVVAYIDGAIYVVGGRDEVGNALRTIEVFRFPVDDEDGAAPAAFALEAGYPNPFSERTTLTLRLAEAGPATLAVYDVRGRRVATLADGPMAAGEHRMTWDGTAADGRPLPAGVYVARLAGSAGHAAAKLTLLR